MLRRFRVRVRRLRHALAYILIDCAKRLLGPGIFVDDE
jgi:hypothetical protein